jgi:KDO2-lipid IV(A) lauroyltransferase
MIKLFVDFLTAFLFNLLGIMGALLSYKQQYKFGVLLGLLLELIMKKRRVVTEENLHLAFPEMSNNAIKSLTKSSFKNMGATIVEISSMKYMSDNRICRKVVEFDDEIFFALANESEKPLMILSSHFNNWELFVYYISKAKNCILNVIAKKQSNAIIDKEINKIRLRAGTRTIEMGNAARKLIPVFQSGGSVAMLVDQSARGDKGVLYPDFFNLPTATYASAAYLSLKFNANMLLMLLIRNDVGKYIMHCEQIQTDDLQCNDEGVEVLTQRHVSALERIIRQHPGQWVWQHRRWKRMPKDYKNAD